MGIHTRVLILRHIYRLICQKKDMDNATDDKLTT